MFRKSIPSVQVVGEKESESSQVMNFLISTSVNLKWSPKWSLAAATAVAMILKWC